jgi:heme exporter protein CcmD
MSMGDFLHMGGYARFVWPAYGLAFAVLAWNVWSAVRLHASARARALRRLAIDAGGPNGSASIDTTALRREAR